jgi:putative flavoprotein involved in K+ transport
MNAARQPPRAEGVSGVLDHFDVAVVGAGQAGLAIGHFLVRHGLRFVVLEAADSVGAAWRTRWNSLVLFTPRRYSGLRGLAFPGNPDGYPTRDEVVAYLEQYAETFALPVRVNAPVRRLSTADGGFEITFDGGRIAADHVVVATGPFQAPRVPPVARELAPDVFQTHSTGYMEPSAVPPGTALVVGGGNTGYQIAEELSSTHRVYLAIGSRQTPLPQRLLGRDLFWWLTKTGLIKKTVDSRLGRRLQHRDTLIGSSPRQLRRLGVELKPRVTGASGRVIRFADGSTLDIDAVIWATGFRSDYSWIEAPVLGPSGHVTHRRGVTEVPGLYFLGLTWQHTRGSALVGWVKEDAEFIATQITDRMRRGDEEHQPPQPERVGSTQGTPASRGG